MASNLEARSILQGLFNKWNKPQEDVQITVSSQPTKLYSLHFSKGSIKNKEKRRYTARFGKINVCQCYEEQMDDVEYDFNNLKNKGCSIIEIQDKLKAKYNISYDKRDYSNHRGAIGNTEYSFRKNSNNRTELWYRFDDILELVCYCDKKEKSKALKECRDLISQDKPKEEIKKVLKQKYRANAWTNRSKKVPSAPLKWNDDGNLLFYGKETNITPYNLDIICSLHANYDNPFTFGDYVLQNLPRALPSAVFYLCENYDMIPKLSSEGKKILDKR